MRSSLAASWYLTIANIERTQASKLIAIAKHTATHSVRCLNLYKSLSACDVCTWDILSSLSDAGILLREYRRSMLGEVFMLFRLPVEIGGLSCRGMSAPSRLISTCGPSADAELRALLLYWAFKLIKLNKRWEQSALLPISLRMIQRVVMRSSTNEFDFPFFFEEGYIVSALSAAAASFHTLLNANVDTKCCPNKNVSQYYPIKE